MRAKVPMIGRGSGPHAALKPGGKAGGRNALLSDDEREVRAVMEEGGMMCHVMQREVIMSLILLFHIPSPQHLHTITAICPRLCFTVPVTNWLPVPPLSSGSSLWISMCSLALSLSRSLSLFLLIVFLSQFSLPLFHFPPNPLNQPLSQVKMPRGRICWSADDVREGSEEHGLQLRPVMSQQPQLIRANYGSALASVDLGWVGLEGINVKWQQVVSGWEHTDRSGTNATLPFKIC